MIYQIFVNASSLITLHSILLAGLGWGSSILVVYGVIQTMSWTTQQESC